MKVHFIASIAEKIHDPLDTGCSIFSAMLFGFLHSPNEAPIFFFKFLDPHWKSSQKMSKST